MDDQGLHVSHIGQQGKQFQVVDEVPGLLSAALDLKGEDGTSPMREILPVQGLLTRIPADGRMMDRFHQGMAFQVINHFQGILHMAFNPEGQGFQTLEEHESMEGGEGCARVP